MDYLIAFLWVITVLRFRWTAGGIFRTIKTVKTVTAELKVNLKNRKSFYTQIVRTIGLNSPFPLKKKKRQPIGLPFFFVLSRKPQKIRTFGVDYAKTKFR